MSTILLEPAETAIPIAPPIPKKPRAPYWWKVEVPRNTRYSENPHVNYWRLDKGKLPEHVNWVCFGLMKDRGLPEAITYTCPIATLMRDSKPLAQDALDFYLAFMLRVIKKDWAPKFRLKRLESRIIYNIDVRGMDWISALFYLTWFRYPYEFPEMVRELFSRKAEGDDDEVLFKKFQEAHNDATAGKICVTSRYPDSHALIYNYNSYSKVPYNGPITLAKLYENIQRKPKTVQEYFR